MNDPEEDIVQRNHHASPPPADPAGKEDIMRANPVTKEPAARIPQPFSGNDSASYPVLAGSASKRVAAVSLPGLAAQLSAAPVMPAGLWVVVSPVGRDLALIPDPAGTAVGECYGQRPDHRPGGRRHRPARHRRPPQPGGPSGRDPAGRGLDDHLAGYPGIEDRNHCFDALEPEPS
jgi:hypothetical protein